MYAATCGRRLAPLISPSHRRTRLLRLLGLPMSSSAADSHTPPIQLKVGSADLLHTCNRTLRSDSLLCSPPRFCSFPVTCSVAVTLLRPSTVGTGYDTLLIKRGKPPMTGHWAFPGGSLEPGETIHHAAQREMKEETSIHVTPIEPFYVTEVLPGAGWGERAVRVGARVGWAGE